MRTPSRLLDGQGHHESRRDERAARQRPQQRGHAGVQTRFGWFFKAPMTPDGSTPEHALHRQERVLLDWVAGASAGR